MSAIAPRTPRCPICKKDRVEAYRPFCSPRCKEVDLHRWFAGSYAIPVVETEENMDSDGGELN